MQQVLLEGGKLAQKRFACRLYQRHCVLAKYIFAYRSFADVASVRLSVIFGGPASALLRGLTRRWLAREWDADSSVVRKRPSEFRFTYQSQQPYRTSKQALFCSTRQYLLSVAC